MKKTNKHSMSRANIPQLAFLIWAILPITESKDWLFYTCSLIIIALLALALICNIKDYLNMPRLAVKEILSFNVQTHIIYLVIYIIGIIVSYSLNHMKMVCLWCGFAILELGICYYLKENRHNKL